MREALDSLGEGKGRLLVVAGGAGLGKSRLAAEAVAVAKERGVLASWGRCRETEGAPAFWPWAQVLRAIRTEAGVVLDAAMGADAAPHYWVRPLGTETSGGPAVAELLGMLFAAFPDFSFEPTHTYHAADALIMEGRMTGTHLGPWAGVPASGKPIEVMTCCIYHFDEDRLVSESVYFDHATLLAQIGVR